MTRRRELIACVAAVVLVTAARCTMFLAPGVRFDSDQAVVGLMAKHISEGRAFPLFFYGQSYLLAVEAYLAAPVMWLLGPTEVALKLPMLAMNVLTAGLLVWRAHRDLGLRPWLALVAALPFALPPLVLGTRFMEAMGGNAVTLLYAVVLWSVRSRPWIFGTIAAVALAQRELTAYPIAALLLLDLAYGGWPTRAAVERWAIAALLVVTLSATVSALRPFAPMFGPGTTERLVLDNLSSDAVVARSICVEPATWPERGTRMLREHLPLMVGGYPSPIRLVGVSSGMGQGNPGLAPWVAALTLAAVIAGVRAWRTPGPPPTAEGVPAAALPWFLLLCGLISTTVYGFLACTQLSPNTMRYDLLLIFVPVGALLAGLRAPAATVRAALVTATLVWVASSFGDYRALAAEVRSGRWPDYRGQAIQMLESRGLTALWGDYRLAYLVSFRAQERVTVAPDESPRIDEYAARAAAAHAPFIGAGECAQGEELVPGFWLCPPPDAK